MRFFAAVRGSRAQLFSHGRTENLDSGIELCVKAWGFGWQALIFVRCGVGYCNAVAIPLPSLGVSSLDLGRSSVSGPFFWPAGIGTAKAIRRRRDRAAVLRAGF